MARRRLLLLQVMAAVTTAQVLFLALYALHNSKLVAVWRTGVGHAGRPPHSQPLRAKEPPLSTVVPHDTGTISNATGTVIASRGGRSGGAGGLLTTTSKTQIHHDLETEFERRRNTTLRGCEKHGARVTLPSVWWRVLLRPVLPGPLTLCMIFKVASKSLWKVVIHLKDQTPATPRPVSALVVRHPLARLASAYRDKFLDGRPISEYNDRWRKTTESKDDWGTRFAEYWLPALVTEGFVPQTRAFNETLQRIKEAYQTYVNHLSPTGQLVTYPSQEEEERHGKKIMQIAYHMLTSGPHYGLTEAFTHSYDVGDIIERYKNSRFTFSQFLHHVVWTHDLGMPDLHWMTYTEMCDPCRRKFDYVLKLETIEEEADHLFRGVLGYPEVSLPRLHRSLDHTLGASDRPYYADVSSDMMERVLAIYWHDFVLFGYDQDV